MTINRIFISILAVCAILIALLFAFRAYQAPKPANNNDESLIFTVGREIKPFELLSANHQVFTQQQLQGHWSLVFFGFTHCSSICPTTLSMLGSAYPLLQARYPNLQVVLISVDPERDKLSELASYAQRFNPHFKGVTGKMVELRKLQAQLGIFSARDTETAGNDYQIQHTSSILLINPRGEWAGVFKYGLTSQQFIQAFEKSVPTHA